MRSVGSKIAFCVWVVVFSMMMVSTGLALATLEADQPGFYGSMLHWSALGLPPLIAMAVVIRAIRRLGRRSHTADSTLVPEPTPKPTPDFECL